jgi:hypothetical protein
MDVRICLTCERANRAEMLCGGCPACWRCESNSKRLSLAYGKRSVSRAVATLICAVRDRWRAVRACDAMSGDNAAYRWYLTSSCDLNTAQTESSSPMDAPPTSSRRDQRVSGVGMGLSWDCWCEGKKRDARWDAGLGGRLKSCMHVSETVAAQSGHAQHTRITLLFEVTNAS